MSESFLLETPRTARVHLAGAAGAAVREVWFLLHGYGQLAEPFLAALAALAGPERLLVAPEALSRFYLRRGTGEVGGSWMTREQRAHEIRDTLGYLERVWGHLRVERRLPDSTELCAFGFSQGGAAAARWAVLGSAPVRRLVSFACPLPPDLDLAAGLERVRHLRWSFALGEADTSIDRPAFEAGLARLRAAGVEPEVLRFAGGHELEPTTLARIASGSLSS